MLDRTRGAGWRSTARAFAALLVCAAASAPARADDALETKQLVEKAKLTFDTFVADPQMKPMHDLLKRAKGVFVAPQVIRGAFVVGASGGSGVFVAKDSASGKWSSPAFYTIGDVSFGLQAGGDASEVVLVALSDRGVSALLSDSLKLGADVGMAVGPVGAGAEASTAGLSADIVSYSRSKGAYAGISLEGSLVKTKPGWNKAFYGQEVTPTDILIKGTATNPAAEPLVSAIAKASSATN
jgi:lipid-binding SYLF domain-containing protein